MITDKTGQFQQSVDDCDSASGLDSVAEELVLILDDQAAVARLSASAAEDESLRSELSQTHSVDAVEQMMMWRSECRCYVLRAVALSERARIHAGQLVVRGSRKEELEGDLEQFNRVPAGRPRSLAAYYFDQLMRGGTSNGR